MYFWVFLEFFDFLEPNFYLLHPTSFYVFSKSIVWLELNFFLTKNRLLEQCAVGLALKMKSWRIGWGRLSQLWDMVRRSYVDFEPNQCT